MMSRAISCLVVISFVGVAVAFIEEGWQCKSDAACQKRTPKYPCCSKFGYCRSEQNYCGTTTKPEIECEDVFPSVQFENVWRKSLLEMAHDGLAKKFRNRKLRTRTRAATGTKVAIIGAGPAGLVAAYELGKYAKEAKSKMTITIFEKDDRLGGRIKTVGKPGYYLPEIWNNKDALSEAGAMRIPLPPQSEMDCYYKSECGKTSCEVGDMDDAAIQNLVHQTSGYEFVEDDAFPHFLLRHYIKKFKVPVFRHNMAQAAHDIFGTVFVMDERSGQFVCKKCRYNEDLSVDQHVLLKIRKVSDRFADDLTKNFNGSLVRRFEADVNEEVKAWIRDHKVLMSKDPANFNEKLDAWKEFHEAWSSTYREHLLRKKWPEGVIDLYEVVYQCLTQSRIRDDIIETTVGGWWQQSGMFSLKNGMYSLFRRSRKATAGTTAFYEEILAMNGSPYVNINFVWNSKIEKIHKTPTGSVVLYKDGAGAGWEHEPTEAGTFDAVISTIPVPFLRNLDIYCGATNISPREALFETDSLFKMQLQFKTRFWNDTRNNRGHFRVSNERGFLTSTDSVAKLRYPRPDEPGNIIMMYVFNEDAEAFAHKVAQQGYMKNATASWAEGKYKVNAGITEVIKMALDQLQKFHPDVKVRREFSGNYFIQPWVQLSMPPSGFHQMTKIQKYCDASPKGVYFAGDGFSFKPQWIEGALYTAFHAIWRLVNDFSGAKQTDPFRIFNDRDYASWT